MAVPICRHALPGRAARDVNPRRRPLLRVRPAAESLPSDLSAVGGAVGVGRRVSRYSRGRRANHADPASAVHGPSIATQYAAAARRRDARHRRRVVRERDRARTVRAYGRREHQLRRAAARLVTPPSPPQRSLESDSSVDSIPLTQWRGLFLSPAPQQLPGETHPGVTYLHPPAFAHALTSQSVMPRVVRVTASSRSRTLWGASGQW